MRILISAIFLLVLLLPTFVLAEFNKLPEVMVGRTIVVTDGRTYHGGMTGNQVIKNYDPNFSELTGFNKSYLIPPTTSTTCYLMQLTQIPQCYKITPSSNILKLMTSRTYFNGNPGLEIATLLYPSATIVGDVYSQYYYFKNFSFIGRNLYKSKDNDSSDSSATWDAPNYTFNPEAQSSFLGEQQDYYRNKIELLKGEANAKVSNDIDMVNYRIWHLQNRLFTSASSDESDMYPEGKTWYMNPAGGELVLDSDITYTYKGKGTIIVDGDLIISDKTRILPDDNDGGSLGIIVLGTVKFLGNNQVRAAIFSENRVNILVPANNVEVMGSVVAKNFRIDAGRVGIRFFYDYNLENNWPPGFRYLNMPHPEISAPYLP